MHSAVSTRCTSHGLALAVQTGVWLRAKKTKSNTALWALWLMKGYTFTFLHLKNQQHCHYSWQPINFA